MSWFGKVLIALAAVLVAGAGVWLAARPAGEKGPADTQTPPTPGPAATPVVAGPPEKSDAAPAPRETEPQAEDGEDATRFIVYYFHRTARCRTCLTIEAYTHDAVQAYFADALANGELEWRSVNIEEPGNEHFETDFGLDRQAVVLVETAGDQMLRWKDLPEVWALVSDKASFQEYIAGGVSAFLEE
jgi:hypothetical protein